MLCSCGVQEEPVIEEPQSEAEIPVPEEEETEEEAKKMDGKLLADIDLHSSKSIVFVVGPEGGISDKEVDVMNENKFLPISLGPRILRTEVAPTYIMSAISYELELGDDHEV